MSSEELVDHCVALKSQLAEVTRERDEARAERERLLSLIQLADIQHMGCGGNLKPEEVIRMMRQVPPPAR